MREDFMWMREHDSDEGDEVVTQTVVRDGKLVTEAIQPPATPQEPDVRGDIGHQNAEIQRLGNAVRDGSATSEMAYAWLTHPYVCTSDMVKAAARIMASTPSPEGQTWQLSADDVEWVVNDNAELGVKIGNQFFFCYKGHSLVYAEGTHDDGRPMMWRRVFKREFGECIHPVNYSRPTHIGTVSLDDSDEWMPLPSHPTPEGTQP